MLDPDLQKELKQISKIVTILHLVMLFEPAIFVAVALILRKSGSFGEAQQAGSILGLMRPVFIGISAATLASAVTVRKMLLSPERLIPDEGDTTNLRKSYTRAQIISNALALTPPTLGLAFFFISGSMDLLIGASAVSLAIMIYTFPRSEELETAVAARIMQGETISTNGKEQES